MNSYKTIRFAILNKCKQKAIEKYKGYDIWELAKGKAVKPLRPKIYYIEGRNENPAGYFDESNIILVSMYSLAEIIGLEKAGKKQEINKRIQWGIRKFNRLYSDNQNNPPGK